MSPDDGRGKSAGADGACRVVGAMSDDVVGFVSRGMRGGTPGELKIFWAFTNFLC